MKDLYSHERRQSNTLKSIFKSEILLQSSSGGKHNLISLKVSQIVSNESKRFIPPQ